MKYILFTILAVIGIFCQPVDSKPPDSSITDDIRSRLIINLDGFTPESQVYVRYWEDGAAYAHPSSYKLYNDAGGRLLLELSLTPDTSSADILLYVDENPDNVLDAADFGYYQSGILVDNQSKRNFINIHYQVATLSTYMSTASLPVSGQEACVYMPPGMSAYSGNLNSRVPKFPDQDITMDKTTLNVMDWFPVTILDSTGVIQSVPLLASWMTPAVNEVCIPI